MDLSCSISPRRRGDSSRRIGAKPTVRSPARAVRCPPCATCGSPGARGARGATSRAPRRGSPCPGRATRDPRPATTAPPRATCGSRRCRARSGTPSDEERRSTRGGKRSARGFGAARDGGTERERRKRAEPRGTSTNCAERTTTAREERWRSRTCATSEASSLAPYGMMNAGGSCRSLPLRARDVRAARVATRRSRAVERIRRGSFRACSGRIVYAPQTVIPSQDQLGFIRTR